jgi:hypothetical protein
MVDHASEPGLADHPVDGRFEMTIGDPELLYQLEDEVWSRLFAWRVAAHVSVCMAAMVAGILLAWYAEPRSIQVFIAVGCNAGAVVGLFGYLAWAAAADRITAVGRQWFGRDLRHGGKPTTLQHRRRRAGAALTPALAIVTIAAGVVVGTAPLTAAAVWLTAVTLAAVGWTMERALSHRLDALRDQIIQTWHE